MAARPQCEGPREGCGHGVMARSGPPPAGVDHEGAAERPDERYSLEEEFQRDEGREEKVGDRFQDESDPLRSEHVESLRLMIIGRRQD